jgi:hypothetical protein
MEHHYVTRRLAAAAALLILGGCGPASTTATDPGGQFAGLDGEILKWRAEIVKSGRLCQGAAEGQKCQGFEVACKAERTITPADQAAGVTAKLVAAMDWDGWDSKLRQPQAGSEAALFTKTGSAWTRTPHAPVNMSSCADL